MMEVTLTEVRTIIDRFPEAEGVGFIVGPALLKLAIATPAYADALCAWLECTTEVAGEGVGELIERGDGGVVFTWELGLGPPLAIRPPAKKRWRDRLLRRDRNVYVVGIKELLELLESEQDG